jgi:hypothetical protein
LLRTLPHFAIGEQPIRRNGQAGRRSNARRGPRRSVGARITGSRRSPGACETPGA